MDHILEIRQATKKFGGLTANENVTFVHDLKHHEIPSGIASLR